MRYWWVNHKQTYSKEVEGGYIWSPKTNSNGSRNQTYMNLTLTRRGDIVISYANQKIKAIGVVTSDHTEQEKPAAFGTAGDAWSDTGWAVPIHWKILNTPLIPKDHISTIAPLLPDNNSPLQANGNGNQGCYLASINEALGLQIIDLIRPRNVESITSIEETQNENENEELSISIENEELSIVETITSDIKESTERDQLIKARNGQGRFKQNVETIETGCRATGVKKKILLIASHIKPWRFSDNAERLDGNNGLLFSPHIDKLFDQGWITFSTNGDLQCQDETIIEVLSQWGINIPLNIGGFNVDQARYLRYHQEYIYRPNLIP